MIEIFNKVRDVLQAAANEKVAAPHTIQKNAAIRFPPANIKIFEVQSAATGDGIYNCYEKKLLAAEWDDTAGTDRFADKDASPTEIEVFNLQEQYVESGYSRALAKYDLIQCFQLNDDGRNMRWMGLPLVPSPRLARANQAAPDATSMTCNLIDRKGNEITSGLGYNITVNAKISGSENLDSVITRIANDDYFFVINIRGVWYIAETFHSSESCVCTAP